jgi:hypothetical protein
MGLSVENPFVCGEYTTFPSTGKPNPVTMTRTFTAGAAQGAGVDNAMIESAFPAAGASVASPITVACAGVTASKVDAKRALTRTTTAPRTGRFMIFPFLVGVADVKPVAFISYFL